MRRHPSLRGSLPQPAARLAPQVNGVSMPALLDTGSPITVLNAAAATAASIELSPAADAANNPFAILAAGFKAAQASAESGALLDPFSSRIRHRHAPRFESFRAVIARVCGARKHHEVCSLHVPLQISKHLTTAGGGTRRIAAHPRRERPRPAAACTGGTARPRRRWSGADGRGPVFRG